MEFQEFPKMARLSREIVVTEKIDGTNAQIYIEALAGYPADQAIAQDGGLAMVAGSRSRWITPIVDNHGFAAWAYANAEELFKLGVGRRFGEWWGSGIQRGYGMSEKRFSLFNTSRWLDPISRPVCCHVVPTLYQGDFSEMHIAAALRDLSVYGSRAAPGFDKPEGVVVFHAAANLCFKKTLLKDEVPKSVAERQRAA